MAVTAYWYGKAFLQVFDKEVDWEADDIRVALCTSTYSPDQDTHDYFNDITNEVVGTNYDAGGAALGTPTIAYTAVGNIVTLDGVDTTWADSTITARYAIVYDNETAASNTAPLLFYIDFGADKSSSGGDFTITWHGDGIGKITVS